MEGHLILLSAPGGVNCWYYKTTSVKLTKCQNSMIYKWWWWASREDGGVGRGREKDILLYTLIMHTRQWHTLVSSCLSCRCCCWKIIFCDFPPIWIECHNDTNESHQSTRETRTTWPESQRGDNNLRNNFYDDYKLHLRLFETLDSIKAKNRSFLEDILYLF